MPVASWSPLVIAAALALAPAASRAGPADLQRLVDAYPDRLERVEDGVLVWRDGTRMAVDDGEAKSEEALIDRGDIEDMFRYRYPAGFPEAPPTEDPGRIRNAAFFKAMYGDCAAGGVEKDLVAVAWLPRHEGGSVRVTRINGVDERLAAVSAELDRLPEAMMGYLKPSAGTFNCRMIAGTSNPSAHGYGIAIDINVERSDYWRWSKDGSYRNRIPREIVEVFERHGFVWGGKWRHFDTMHFEYRPELLD